jgi:hypothetical protein
MDPVFFTWLTWYKIAYHTLYACMIDTIELDHGSVSQLSHYVLSAAKGGEVGSRPRRSRGSAVIRRCWCRTGMQVQDFLVG